MTPGKRRSSEPRHLARMQKTCPRRDCPNPTRGMEWRGSPKQLQYHCFGCWRKFNYGGILRSWATQVTPSVAWLRGLPEHERSKPPDLLDPPRRSVSPEHEPRLRSVSPELEPILRRSVSPVPDPPRRSVSPVPAAQAAQQVHGLAAGQAEPSVASSSQIRGRAARGLHDVADSYLTLGPAELGLERNLRADNVQRKESGARAMQGYDREAGGSASADIDLVGNCAGEGARNGIRAPTPTWHDLKIDLTPFDTFDEFGVGGSPSDLLLQPFDDFGVGGWNDFIPQPLGEFGVGDSALPTLSFNSADSFWEDGASSFGIEFPAVAVPEPPGTIIISASDNSHDVQSSNHSNTASSASPTAEHLVLPQGKTVKISFLRYAVPTVTCMYALSC